MSGFTHFDGEGNAVMVDVGSKDITQRCAVAEGAIRVSAEVLRAIQQGDNAKGDVLGVARIAGIMAVKNTSSLIPLCHPLLIHRASVDFSLSEDEPAVKAVCCVAISGKTGVEMEALTGVSVALLTIYDMCKAIDRRMTIDAIRLVEKSGGASGHFLADAQEKE